MLSGALRRYPSYNHKIEMLDGTAVDHNTTIFSFYFCCVSCVCWCRMHGLVQSDTCCLCCDRCWFRARVCWIPHPNHCRSYSHHHHHHNHNHSIFLLWLAKPRVFFARFPRPLCGGGINDNQPRSISLLLLCMCCVRECEW